MRKLASIQRIIQIEPIENADNIEHAKVLGWHLVVKKGEFKKNDLCVYVEIDSILPERPEFEFLRSKGFRIKTIKLRKKISQGIAFPLSILPAGDYRDGDDVTEILQVKKYEPPSQFSIGGDTKGNFPGFLVKTDQTRIQSAPDVLTRHKDKLFYVTEKLDGTSATFYFNNGEFGVCSRNLEMKETEKNLYWQVANQLNLRERLSGFGKNIAIQGEIIGPGIQKNRYGLDERKLFVFDVFDIDKHEYYDFEGLICVAIGYFGLQTVPIISQGWKLFPSVDEMVEFAQRTSLLNSNTKSEGIVVCSMSEASDDELGRLSFKVINPEYLLKYDE